MLFETPALDDHEHGVLHEIDGLRQTLRWQIAAPRRWVGSLRRLTFARAVQGSNTIEGYNATLDDVAAVVAGEEPLEASEETRRALAGYRDAMTYVLQLSEDPHFVFDETLLRSLHFMMMSYDLSKNPGRWRPGAVYVRNEATGTVVYEGPDVELVPVLVAELVKAVNAHEETHALVRAAMAHLNLVLIHPFSDGNGRMGRCVQTLVLAREAILEPPFASIEEYLGANTQAYYDVLAGVGQGSWHPENDARPWVRFSLTAHLRQAKILLARVKESEELWDRCVVEAQSARLPPRIVPVLFNTALGFRAQRSLYRSLVEEDVSDAMATRDLRAMADAGLLVAHGERRGRFYTASAGLRAIAVEIRGRRPRLDDSDPFP
ncbi:MAG: Fic family protein [Gaiella sp.]|nr:Fic family protein [Gaiella sp.]